MARAKKFTRTVHPYRPPGVKAVRAKDLWQPEVQARMVRRLVRFYNRATPEQMAAGLSWYRRARGLVAELANSAGWSMDRAAAVVASLSINTSWGQNVILAREFFARGGSLWEGAQVTPNARDRIEAILASPDLDRDGLLAVVWGKAGQKVANFFRNLVPGWAGGDGLTMDRWAVRGAVHIGLPDQEAAKYMTGRTIDGNPGKYDAVAAAYEEAARQLGIAKHRLQAVVWVVVRDLVGHDTDYDLGS